METIVVKKWAVRTLIVLAALLLGFAMNRNSVYARTASGAATAVTPAGGEMERR